MNGITIWRSSRFCLVTEASKACTPIRTSPSGTARVWRDVYPHFELLFVRPSFGLTRRERRRAARCSRLVPRHAQRMHADALLHRRLQLPLQLSPAMPAVEVRTARRITPLRSLQLSFGNAAQLSIPTLSMPHAQFIAEGKPIPVVQGLSSPGDGGIAGDARGNESHLARRPGGAATPAATRRQLANSPLVGEGGHRLALRPPSLIEHRCFASATRSPCRMRGLSPRIEPLTRLE